MIKWLEIALALIAYAVFLTLLMTHAAPWWLIGTYWCVLTVKNFIPIFRNR